MHQQMSVVRPIGTLALSSLAKKAHFISRRYFFKVFDCCAEFLVNMFGIGIILCSDELYWHSCSMPFPPRKSFALHSGEGKPHPFGC